MLNTRSRNLKVKCKSCLNRVNAGRQAKLESRRQNIQTQEPVFRLQTPAPPVPTPQLATGTPATESASNPRLQTYGVLAFTVVLSDE